MAKFSVPRSGVLLISKFMFQNLVLLGLSVPWVLLPKFRVLASQTISISSLRFPIPVLFLVKCNFGVLAYLILGESSI